MLNELVRGRAAEEVAAGDGARRTGAGGAVDLAAVSRGVALGDERALAVLYELWFERAVRLAGAGLRRTALRGAGEEACLDVVQDAFVRVTRGMRPMAQGADVERWMVRVIKTAALDHLRQGIHLRGYAQKNPTQEYKREAFELFSLMLEMIKTDVTRILMTVHIRSAEELEAVEEPEVPVNVQYQHADFAEAAATESELEADSDVAVAEKPRPFIRGGQKVGRNDPCPCGSGRKYKHCHGKLS